MIPPRVGFRHFRDGFTKFKQHSGKETKDLERVFLAIIAGHEKVSKGTLKALRGFLDFIYLAQYESHSTATLQYLEDALKKFHRYKCHIAASGVRDGPQQNNKFNIPKIELMQHVKRLVELLGSALQFSSEQTERCHINLAKEPYKATNRKQYAGQMCRYQDRNERVRLFSILTKWFSAVNGSTSTNVHEKRHAARYLVFEQLAGAFLPSPVRDVFQAKASLCNETTAFQLTQNPHIFEILPSDVESLYGIPGFLDDLRKHFAGARAPRGVALPFVSIRAWKQVRLQLKDPQDPTVVLPPYTVQASPPMKPEDPPLYDFVLLHDIATDGYGNLNGFGVHGK